MYYIILDRVIPRTKLTMITHSFQTRVIPKHRSSIRGSGRFSPNGQEYLGPDLFFFIRLVFFYWSKVWFWCHQQGGVDTLEQGLSSLSLPRQIWRVRSWSSHFSSWYACKRMQLVGFWCGDFDLDLFFWYVLHPILMVNDCNHVFFGGLVGFFCGLLKPYLVKIFVGGPFIH